MAYTMGFGYLVNYVVMSGARIKDRHIQHLRTYLDGESCFYTAEGFSSANKILVYHPNQGMRIYIEKFDNLSKDFKCQLKSFRIFYLPYSKDKEILERLNKGGQAS